MIKKPEVPKSGWAERVMDWVVFGDGGFEKWCERNKQQFNKKHERNKV